MAKYLLIIFFSLLVLVACGGEKEQSPDVPQIQAASLRVTVSEAMMFARPSRDSAVLFRFIEGDQLPILAQTEPDITGVVWYQVAQGDQFGWMAGSQVEVSGDFSSVRIVDASIWDPTATPATPTEALTSTPYRLPEDVVGIVNVSQATVFDTPFRSAPEVGNLFEGEETDILGRIVDNGEGDAFYFVGKNRVALGWVLAAQLTIQGDLETVPLLEDTLLSISAVRADETATIQANLSSPTPILENRATTEPTPPATELAAEPSATSDLASTALAAPTATDFPEYASPTALPTPTGEIKLGVPPPLEMDLPEGWKSLDVLVPINSIYIQGDLPVSIYEGELGDGVKGTIWIVWGFPNVTSPSGEINLYGDGVQLLRSFIFDPTTCNIGLGSQPGEKPSQYVIGGREAVGTTYAAVDCVGSPDIAGFFAVLQVGGGNFAFFVGVEPVEAVAEGLPLVQTMLDSVRFVGLEESTE
jgi:hypothetical protein